jgi:hypothetical protein
MTLPPVLLPEHPTVVLLLERALVSLLLAIHEHGEYEDLRGSGRQSVIPYVHGRTRLYCSNLPCLCEPKPFFDPEVAPVRAFYNSMSGNYNESQGPTGGIGAGQTLCCRAQWLGVANDVFNGVGISGLVTCHPALSQWYGVVSLRH